MKKEENKKSSLDALIINRWWTPAKVFGFDLFPELQMEAEIRKVNVIKSTGLRLNWDALASDSQSSLLSWLLTLFYQSCAVGLLNNSEHKSQNPVYSPPYFHGGVAGLFKPSWPYKPHSRLASLCVFFTCTFRRMWSEQDSEEGSPRKERGLLY